MASVPRDPSPSVDVATAPCPEGVGELSDSAHRDEIVKRLRRAEGQLRGVVRMVESGEGCLPVAQQLTAVRKALDAALSRMTVCYLEQELADAAKADPAIGRTIEKVGVLINRLG
ncbi:MAG: metal-sensing transcriptional repressor [Lautropia sp.]